jgi:flagellar hook-length control protein FliK
LAQGLLPISRIIARIAFFDHYLGNQSVLNETNILNSILEIPVKPEPSFQVSHLERSESERFDHFLRNRVDSHRDKPSPASSQTFEPKERSTPEHAGPQTPVARDKPTPPTHTENQHSDSRPVISDGERQGTSTLRENEALPHSDESTPKEQVNPFTLPLERLASELNQTDVLENILNTRLSEKGSAAIDTLKELLAGLNVNSETIDQLVQALNNGDTAGLQNILNALRGLLQTSNQVTQTSASEIVAEISANRLNLSEQKAVNLLVRAGLTQEEAQQVIQQVRGGNTVQPATDNSTQLAKTAVDTIASKLNSENSNGSGNLQNGDSSGSAKHSSEGPRNAAGLTAERLDTLASLIAPDKAGNAQTNPLIAKPSASPLLNLNTPGQPGVLAEGTQAPAAVADAAAKGAEFVKSAVTETYNGRASMDKPITAQIIEKFSLRGFGNHREVQIKLDPPSLGTIRMNVSTSGESVRATIVAENNIVKSVIENNLSQLKDSITHQGIKIDSFNVLVGGNASHSAEGHKSALDYLGQLGREGSMNQEPAEEIMTLHRTIFLNENQSFSIFA